MTRPQILLPGVPIKKEGKMRTLTVVLAVIFIFAAMTMAFADEKGVPRVKCNADSGTLIPYMVAQNTSPCPGKIYCEHPDCNSGEGYCCEWGYFYSNPCTCRCYKSSYDAGADCNSYFRCQ